MPPKQVWYRNIGFAEDDRSVPVHIFPKTVHPPFGESTGKMFTNVRGARLNKSEWLVKYF